MNTVAVYVGLELPIPSILAAAAQFGATISAHDVSSTDGYRVFYVDADIAVRLAEHDERLKFLPPLAVPEPAPEPQPEPEPVVAAKVLTAEPAPQVDIPTRTRTSNKPPDDIDAEAAPVKKRAAKKTRTTKKTTATKRKTRGAHGGES